MHAWMRHVICNSQPQTLPLGRSGLQESEQQIFQHVLARKQTVQRMNHFSIRPMAEHPVGGVVVATQHAADPTFCLRRAKL